MVTIRQATSADLDLVCAISSATFYETFKESNTAEDMNKYLFEHFSPAQIQKEIDNPDSIFYLAFVNDVAMGYLKLNTGKAQTEAQDLNALEIERIYVSQNAQGLGIGRSLLETALNELKIKDYAYLWLGVWENNYKALRFYEKNGFVAFGEHTFVLGDDPQRDILMKYTIQ